MKRSRRVHAFPPTRERRARPKDRRIQRLFGVLLPRGGLCSPRLYTVKDPIDADRRLDPLPGEGRDHREMATPFGQAGQRSSLQTNPPARKRARWAPILV